MTIFPRRCDNDFMSDRTGAIRGPIVVWVLAASVALVSIGLIWYKQRPQLRTLPFTLSTPTGKMYLVPSGAFFHGPDGKERAVVPSFYIDATEVTVEHFRRFCQATGHPQPPGLAAAKPEYPVVNVTVEDAEAFAKWAGKRLPDSLEWEKAARGTRGAQFPWGENAEVRRANVLGTTAVPYRGLLPADSMPQHASPARALHMAGNAAEWTRTSVREAPRRPSFVVRGGSYLQSLDEARVWRERVVYGGERAPDIGFRCAKDRPD